MRDRRFAGLDRRVCLLHSPDLTPIRPPRQATSTRPLPGGFPSAQLAALALFPPRRPGLFSFKFMRFQVLCRFQIGFVWRFFWRLHTAREALPDAVALARSICRVRSPRGTRFQILSVVEFTMTRWKSCSTTRPSLNSGIDSLLSPSWQPPGFTSLRSTTHVPFAICHLPFAIPHSKFRDPELGSFCINRSESIGR